MSKQITVYDLDWNPVLEFESINAAAKHFNVSHQSIDYWLRTGYAKRGYRFRFSNPEDEKVDCVKMTRYASVADVDKELDDKRYEIVNYEVRDGRVCITPCKFREHPRPFIGSVQCALCPSFRGRNKEKHQVACSRVNKYLWMK